MLAAATLMAAAVLPAACTPASAPSEVPADAMQRHINQIANGDFGAAWDELHPAHQALVSRDQFIACGPKVSVRFEVVKIEIQAVKRETINVADIPQKQGYTIDLSVRAIAAPTKQIPIHTAATSYHTYHEVQVGSHYRWMLPSDQVELARRGKCPSGTE